MPRPAMIARPPAGNVAIKEYEMIRSMCRILLGMAVGSIVLLAMVIAYATDVTDREDGIRDVF